MSEETWLTKSQIMVLLAKSSRTIDLYVKAGRIERRMDGPRAYFRVAQGDAVTVRNEPSATESNAELIAAIHALREEISALRVTVSQQQALLQEGDAAQDRNAAQRASWWRRLLGIDAM